MAGRPRKADPSEVLDAAMRAFWAKGYDGTSMSDLTAATGLHKASLYQAFGDKRSLFINALEFYINDTLEGLKSCQQGQQDPLLTLNHAFDYIMNKCREGRGCLAVNSLVEMAPYDPQVNRTLKQFQQKVEQFVRKLIADAQAEKQLSRKLNVSDSARLLVVFLFGLTTQMAAGMSSSKARRLITEHSCLILQLNR